MGAGRWPAGRRRMPWSVAARGLAFPPALLFRGLALLGLDRDRDGLVLRQVELRADLVARLDLRQARLLAVHLHLGVGGDLQLDRRQALTLDRDLPLHRVDGGDRALDVEVFLVLEHLGAHLGFVHPGLLHPRLLPLLVARMALGPGEPRKRQPPCHREEHPCLHSPPPWCGTAAAETIRRGGRIGKPQAVPRAPARSAVQARLQMKKRLPTREAAVAPTWRWVVSAG